MNNKEQHFENIYIVKSVSFNLLHLFIENNKKHFKLGIYFIIEESSI